MADHINIATILINYNSKADTLDCLKSLLCSTIPTTVVVVDNNSTQNIDDSDIEFYKNCVLIKNTENLGFGRANNVGVDWCLKNRKKITHFFILNNDTVVYPNTIKELLDGFALDTSIGVTAPKILFYHNPTRVWYGGGQWSNIYGRPLVETSCVEANKSKYVTFATGCALLIKREVWTATKGFDERFFMYVEDVDFSKRVTDLGYKIFYSANVEILHKVNGSTQSNNYKGLHPKNQSLAFQAYHKIKNTLLLMRTHMNGIPYFIFISIYSIFLLKKAILFLFYDRRDALSAITKAIRDYNNEK